MTTSSYAARTLLTAERFYNDRLEIEQIKKEARRNLVDKMSAEIEIENYAVYFLEYKKNFSGKKPGGMSDLIIEIRAVPKESLGIVECAQGVSPYESGF